MNSKVKTKSIVADSLWLGTATLAAIVGIGLAIYNLSPFFSALMPSSQTCSSADPFSVACAVDCNQKNSLAANKLACVKNSCLAKYGSSTALASAVADCGNALRVNFSPWDAAYKITSNCTGATGDPASANCQLAAGFDLTTKVTTIKSSCDVKYGVEYVGLSALSSANSYNCQVQANYGVYDAVNTLINCAGLNLSQANIDRCASYINRSLTYGGKDVMTNYNQRLSEICGLVGTCNLAPQFTPAAAAVKKGTKGPAPCTTVLCLLSSAYSFLSGTCIDTSFGIPPFNFQINSGLWYAGLLKGGITNASPCRVACPANADGSYGGSACGGLIAKGGDHGALRPDIAALVERCAGNDVPDSCRIGTGLFDGQEVCQLKAVACESTSKSSGDNCLPSEAVLKACCGGIVTPVHDSGSGKSKINLHGSDIIGEESFLNQVARLYSNMSMNQFDIDKTCDLLPAGCTVQTSYTPVNKNPHSPHLVGLALDFCCPSPAAGDTLIGRIRAGGWGALIIREISAKEKNCNGTINCDNLVHIDTNVAARPGIAMPCLFTGCDYNNCQPGT